MHLLYWQCISSRGFSEPTRLVFMELNWRLASRLPLINVSPSNRLPALAPVKVVLSMARTTCALLFARSIYEVNDNLK